MSTSPVPPPEDAAQPATPPPAEGTPPADSSATPPAETQPRRIEPLLRLIVRWALVVAAIYAVGWLLMSASSALTPFILGLVLAYLLLPIVNRLNRRMPRWLAILLVYLGLAAVGGIAVAYIIPPAAAQIGQLIDSIPSIAELEKLGADLLQYYRTNVPADLHEPIDTAVASALRSIQSNLTAYAQSLGGFVVGRVLQVINTLTYVIGLLIIPIWLFFVLNDQSKGSAAIDRMVHPRARPDFWNTWKIINAVLSNYVRGQLVLGLAVGTAVGIGLTVLSLFGFHIPYILLL